MSGNSLQMVYVMLRLNRWRAYVRWVTSDGVSDPKPARVVSWFGNIMQDRVQQSRSTDCTACPVDVGEAMETQRCICALPEYLRLTVVEDYLVGGDQAHKAWALGIEVRAFQRRRDAAHAALLDLFGAAAAGLPLECAHKRSAGRPPVVRENSLTITTC